MYYQSTRGGIADVTAAEAIKMGIAPDGGLFVPETIPQLSMAKIRELRDITYQQRAIRILPLFLTDYTAEEIMYCVNNAYCAAKFDDPAIAPLHKLNEQTYCLELWHGPTCAFKDMALQILPYFLRIAADKLDEKAEIVILVATSGDTGKAALEGFKDVPKIRIIVFYPAEGVSAVQKRQMVTQEGNNVDVVAVKGNFDDTQNGVKRLFTDEQFKQRLQAKGRKFSSANSINWGRLLPQIVYYFAAYADLLQKAAIKSGESVNFVVPTGNFGNILAAYYAKRMGLPINRLICAANENNVLTDFIKTGCYDRNRAFKKTISPSMDILISSNLERLLFELSGHDTTKIKQWMEELNRNGRYQIDDDTFRLLQSLFWSGYATEAETLQTIRDCYQTNNYVIDTHTAVAKKVADQYVQETGDNRKTIIASTASPFKFNTSVCQAIMGDAAIVGKDEFTLLEMLAQVSSLAIPTGLQNLNQRPVLHDMLCEKTEMEAVVSHLLEL